MGKRISMLAAALFAIAIGTPQMCCTSMQPKPANIIESRDSQTRRDLDDIVRSVHCVRTSTVYQLDGAPAGTPPVTKKGHGTALAYTMRDGYTYLVTNVHVVSDPDVVNEPEIVPTPKGLALIVNTYKKVSSKTYLVDDANDSNDADDIAVEEVSKDEKLDIAVVRAKQLVHVAGSYVRDPSIEPRVGDEVFVVGYPRGRFSAVTRGIVSHPDYVGNDGEHLDVLDVTSTFGNSGSPYFIRRGDTLYWAGTMGKIMPYGEGATLFTLGTPIKTFDGLLDTSPKKK